MGGNYIIFEGVVGTGKSTQATKLYEYLKKKYPQKEVILTREPGGSEIAETIRKLVQGTEFNEKMTSECEAYLYAASRAQTIKSIVKPVLDKDGIVISDRSFISSLAYQGFTRGLSIEKVLEINKIALNNVFPSLVIYINLDLKTGLGRTFDKEGDKFEKENISFFEKIDRGYIEVSLFPQFKNIWVNIDGSGDKEAVFNRIKKSTMDFLHL
jgi:dTMP kinase